MGSRGGNWNDDDDDDIAGGWRWSGKDRISGLIGIDECRSRSVRVVVRYSERVNRWRESCTNTAILAKTNPRCDVSTNEGAYLFCASRIQDIERAVS